MEGNERERKKEMARKKEGGEKWISEMGMARTSLETEKKNVEGEGKRKASVCLHGEKMMWWRVTTAVK